MLNHGIPEHAGKVPCVDEFNNGLKRYVANFSLIIKGHSQLPKRKGDEKKNGNSHEQTFVRFRQDQDKFKYGLRGSQNNGYHQVTFEDERFASSSAMVNTISQDSHYKPASIRTTSPSTYNSPGRSVPSSSISTHPTCKTCGHKHPASSCYFKTASHPDINNSDYAFTRSVVGKLYLALVPPREHLDR
jgi:hypothetical protein